MSEFKNNGKLPESIIKAVHLAFAVAGKEYQTSLENSGLVDPATEVMPLVNRIIDYVGMEVRQFPKEIQVDALQYVLLAVGYATIMAHVETDVDELFDLTSGNS